MKNRTIQYLKTHLLDLQDAYNACECNEDRAEVEADMKTVVELIEWLEAVNLETYKTL